MSSNRILDIEGRTPEKKLKESSSFASQNNSFSLKTSSSSTSSPSISNSHCQGDNYLIQRNDSFTTTNSKVLLFPTPFSFSLSTPIRFFPSKRRFTLNNKTRLNNVALCNSNNKFNSAIASIKEANFAKFENTEVLRVSIKTGKNEYKTFKVRKYDNVFLNLDIFFKVNKISKPSLIRPIAYKIFKAMSQIYSMMNNSINKKDQEFLLSLSKQSGDSEGRIS